MATTLEFTTSTSVPISPSVHGNWSEGAAPTDFTRRVMSESDSGSTADREFTGSVPLGGEVCQVQYISQKKLRSQTISGNFSISSSQRVSVTGATHFAFHARIVNGSGTTQDVLCDLTTNTNAIPAATYDTVSDSGSLSSGSADDGDYLVVEIGYTVNNTSEKTFGTQAGAGDFRFTTDTILWLEAPANLTYSTLSEEVYVMEAITQNNPTYTDNGGTITFAIQTGSLPPGVSLNANTGVITGTPTASGVYTFTVRASNSEGSTDSPSITYTVEMRGASLNLRKLAAPGIEL